MWLHLTCSYLSYAAFLVTFITGLLFLIQERQIKRKRLGALFHRLPPLETMDRINFAAITAGFLLLTLGTLAGFVAVKSRVGRWWINDPKQHLTVVLWLAYALLWWLRSRAALRGHWVALLSIAGFLLALISLLGVHHVASTL
jgi:ABC-type transport system involved in cytochrome c biogenesis permease subunit